MKFIEETDTEIIRNIMDPEDFVSDSFEAVNIGMDAILICGMLKDQPLVQLQLNPDRLYVQGVKFLKPTWDLESALDWLKENQKNFDSKEAGLARACFEALHPDN